MADSKHNHLKTKIFIGFPAPPDLKMTLNKNHEWKNMSIMKEHEETPLSVVRYNNREYIGQYVNSSLITIKALKEKAYQIKHALSRLIPDHACDLSDIQVFSQVFIS